MTVPSMYMNINAPFFRVSRAIREKVNGDTAATSGDKNEIKINDKR